MNHHLQPRRTLLDKLWDAHVVVPETASSPAILYIDLHLIHEVTSPQAFSVLHGRGLAIRQPRRNLATLDHSIPTTKPNSDGVWPGMSDSAVQQVRALIDNCATHDIELHGADSRQRGIVHVMAPELGATWPGMTIVCGDSHTSTHGAFGALAFGIGTTEVAHVLATQCLLQRKPKSMALNLEGSLPPDVTAKDLILAILGTIGVDGGNGHVIEYRGAAVTGLPMDARMTLCNMSIEAGARGGLIAPDATTFAALRDSKKAPSGPAWNDALQRWEELYSDRDAAFDKQITINVSALEPQITYGTSPGMVVPIGGHVPDDANKEHRAALEYMGLTAGQRLLGHPVDVAFIGSCTNGRISDLQQAASVLRGRRIASSVRALVVPGSRAVQRQAEAEGLDEVFVAAGAEWREPGCSMCIAMNGDMAEPGRSVVSTSNRNFRGRQGVGARTFLASPATAAASAVAGSIADPRDWTPLSGARHA